jgi:hypothetical protein
MHHERIATLYPKRAHRSNDLRLTKRLEFPDKELARFAVEGAQSTLFLRRQAGENSVQH